MTCPYCGAELEAGVIQSPHELSWLPKRAIAARASLHEGAVVLSEVSLVRGSAVRAYLCRSCAKVIIDYRNGCDLN